MRCSCSVPRQAILSGGIGRNDRERIVEMAKQELAAAQDEGTFITASGPVSPRDLIFVRRQPREGAFIATGSARMDGATELFQTLSRNPGDPRAPRVVAITRKTACAMKLDPSLPEPRFAALFREERKADRDYQLCDGRLLFVRDVSARSFVCSIDFDAYAPMTIPKESKSWCRPTGSSRTHCAPWQAHRPSPSASHRCRRTGCGRPRDRQRGRWRQGIPRRADDGKTAQVAYAAPADPSFELAELGVVDVEPQKNVRGGARLAAMGTDGKTYALPERLDHARMAEQVWRSLDPLPCSLAKTGRSYLSDPYGEGFLALPIAPVKGSLCPPQFRQVGVGPRSLFGALPADTDGTGHLRRTLK